MAVDPDLPPLAPSGRRFLAWAPLLRAVGLAGDARKLVLALIGLALLVVGWGRIDAAFGVRPLPGERPDPAATLRFDEDLVGAGVLSRAAGLVSEPARVVAGPFVVAFTRGVGPRDWLRAVLMGAWAVIVWGICGGAIARIAVVQLTVGGGVGVASALRFALGRATSLIVAPLTPFVAVAFFAAGLAGFGLLYRIPGGIGVTVAGLLGFVPLLLALVMALILVGLALGWPLMHATVAAEGEDVADALSRSYSYVNQRPLRYLAHLAAAWALGVVGFLLAVLFARVVLGLADWGVALGAPDRPRMIPLASMAHGFWNGAIGWAAHAYLYAYFWSVAAAIYLVLRQDVDGTDPHDVYLAEQAADTFAGGPDPATPGPSPTADAPEGSA